MVTELLRRCWFAGASLAAVLTWGQGAEARSPSCESVERVVLANGIEVLLVAEPAAPSLAVVSSVHVGSRNDPPGYEGLAHFVEHLATRKTTRYPASEALYREAGAFEQNARTRPDTTDYFAVLPAAQLERALWLEARRLAMGLDVLDERAATQEREVLQREHNQRFNLGPGQLSLQTVEESLFPAPHPYHLLLEDKHSLGRLTLTEARAFFAHYYRPDRVRVVLLGGLESARARPLLERHLGSLPATTGSPDAQALAERDCAAARAAPAAAPAQRLVIRSQQRAERVEYYWPLAAGEDGQRWR